jgi:hypothetical protein
MERSISFACFAVLVLVYSAVVGSSDGFLLVAPSTSTRSTTTTATNSASSSSSSTTRLFLSPSQLISKGMQQFRQGDIQGSIDSFDASVPPGAHPYLWQRGISYYYLDDFQGTKQQQQQCHAKSFFHNLIPTHSCAHRTDFFILSKQSQFKKPARNNFEMMCNRVRSMSKKLYGTVRVSCV